MGIGSTSIKFLCAAKSLGIDFEHTLTLGRQMFWPDDATLTTVLAVLGAPAGSEVALRTERYSEAFFALLGAKTTATMDASDYEGATILHDLNQPVPSALRERFSVVHDGGTLEHIFNIPQALKNSMEMIRVGGYFTQVNEANNYMGHGFWQFCPELIYRVFSPANGFEVKAVLLHENVERGRWFLARDPDQIRRRVELCNSLPTAILTIAQRTTRRDIFATTPQQSDYVAAWDGAAAAWTPSTTDAQTPGRRSWTAVSAAKRLLKLGLAHAAPRKRGVEFDPTCYVPISEHDLLRGYLLDRART